MLSPAFLYLDPVHAFLSNEFSHNTILIRFILGSENLQRFPLTYWIEYICLARPYIIWLQPTFPGSSFTSLFFSQSSPFVLLSGVLCLLIFVSAVPKLSPLSFLLYFSRNKNLRGLSLILCAWNTTMKYHAVYPRHSPQALRSPSRAAQQIQDWPVSSWEMSPLLI